MSLYYDMHLISITHLTELITFGNTCTYMNVEKEK